MEVRDERKRGWYYVENVIIDAHLADIGTTAFSLYCVLARFTDHDSRACWPSIRTLAKRMGCSVNTIRTATATLTDAGLIAVEKRLHEDGSSASNFYRLLAIPDGGIGVSETDIGGAESDTPPYQELIHPPSKNCTTPLPKTDTEQDSSNKTHLTRPIEGGEDARKRAASAPFVKPALDELRAEFTVRGYPDEAEAFYDHYEANGWRVGRAPGTPMKSWQASVGNWLRNKQTFDAERINRKRTNGKLNGTLAENAQVIQAQLDAIHAQGGTF